MVYKTIKAVFDSKCVECGKPIKKGELSTYDTGRHKMICSNCNALSGELGKIVSKDVIVKEKKDIPENVTVTIKADIEKELSNLRGAIDNETPKIHATVKESVEKMLIKEFGVIPKTIIELKAQNGKTKKIKEITHPLFPDVIKLINADVPVFLMGAAGTGKNHLCKQVADALGLEFYFSNAVSNEYKITGFIDANGKYHETQFYEAFTKGGLFFFDEIDASVPEVLVLLNAAIENRYFNFPTGKVTAHPNFRIIAAGNTYGSGASVQYVGRYQLDAASLDRFALIEMDYDDNVELLIANGDTELVAFIHVIRRIVVSNGLRIVVSYRAINQITKMVKGQGMSVNTALKYSLIKGLSIDDMNIIKRNLPRNSTVNKYISEFISIIDEKTR